MEYPKNLYRDLRYLTFLQTEETIYLWIPVAGGRGAVEEDYYLHTLFAWPPGSIWFTTVDTGWRSRWTTRLVQQDTSNKTVHICSNGLASDFHFVLLAFPHGPFVQFWEQITVVFKVNFLMTWCLYREQRASTLFLLPLFSQSSFVTICPVVPISNCYIKAWKRKVPHFIKCTLGWRWRCLDTSSLTLFRIKASLGFDMEHHVVSRLRLILRRRRRHPARWALDVIMGLSATTSKGRRRGIDSLSGKEQCSSDRAGKKAALKAAAASTSHPLAVSRKAQSHTPSLICQSSGQLLFWSVSKDVRVELCFWEHVSGEGKNCISSGGFTGVRKDCFGLQLVKTIFR